MNTGQPHYVFGPVPSRRLGRSLGVDLLPFKTCTYDCIYCQLGRTTHKTAERAAYVPAGDVTEEVRRKLDEDVRPDYVTLSGSGEPTLHSGFGSVIAAIKRVADVPVAVLTNGSLLWDDEVVAQLREADLVVPSLDAGDERLFRYVNRPHEAVSFEAMVCGLTRLRDHFSGKIWLEIMILGGLTTDPTEVERLREIAQRVRPDRIQLNTAVRPPAEDSALPVAADALQHICRQMGAGAEVIADFGAAHAEPSFRSCREDILALLERRPCTLRDIAAALDLHANEAAKFVEALQRQGRVVATRRDGAAYFRASRDADA